MRVPLTVRQRLTDGASEKQTFHLELDLSGTGISYAVGDCLAIMPHNPPELVTLFLAHFGVSPETPIETRGGEVMPFLTFLTMWANLLLIPKALTALYGEGDYLPQLLPRLTLPLKEFCLLLAPLPPRFYSIASSMHTVGAAAHLTVTLNQNTASHPLPYGTCSDFLCHRVPLNQPLIEVAHHPARKFGLPLHSDTKPIIMVGPGTGIAPFRGFMQERIQRGASAQNWLFFGEQTAQGHYYYRHEWENYTAQGLLRLDLAFSRDTPQKIYVQHKLWEQRAALWEWLHHQGGYFFVCGDASRMAKAVEETLLALIQSEGTLSAEEAKLYLKRLRHEGRYLRDVY